MGILDVYEFLPLLNYFKQRVKSYTVTVKGKFNLKTLLSLPNFYLATLSHDKTKLAFYYDKTGRMELYVMGLASGEYKQVSNGETPRVLRSGFIWARNDVEILFTKDKDGNEQNDIYSFNTESGELKELHISPTSQEYVIHTSENGEWVTFNSNKDGQMNVYKMSLDGTNVSQLTATDNPSMGGTFSPDGKYIAFGTNEEGNLVNNDIYLLNTETGDVERVIQVKVGSRDGFQYWSQDGSLFSFNTDALGSTQAGIYNMETKEIKYFGDGSYNIIAGRITSDNKKLICLVNRNASVSPAIFDIESGEMKSLNFPPGIAAGSQLIDDRYLILSVNMPTSPSSLIMYDLSENTSKTLIAADTGDVDPSLFSDAEHIWYESSDGAKIPAIIYRPRDFDPTKKYPGIVHAHGGPTGQFFMNFSLFGQIMNDLGYVVIQPNVRGSTGYGVEFRDTCIKDWGGKDHEDWKSARQYLIDHVSADPNRIGIYGGSYGGYAATWCAGKSPELWNAIIANVPITHIRNLWDKQMPHFKYYLKMQMGDPEKDKELWDERSPLNYAQNVKNPILLMHGENDPRCPVTESTNYITKLKEAGKKEGPDGDYEFKMWGDIGHGGASDISFRIREYEVIMDFFDRRL